ncbi:MAG: hypothetical protein ABIN96_13570 [Rubrivivax sp.]
MRLDDASDASDAIDKDGGTAVTKGGLDSGAQERRLLRRHRIAGRRDLA